MSGRAQPRRRQPSPAQLIQQAYDAKSEAEAAMTALMEKLYPVGADIEWLHGSRHRQTGRVVDHGFFDTVIVHNDRTDQQVRISAYDVLQGLQGGRA